MAVGLQEAELGCHNQIHGHCGKWAALKEASGGCEGFAATSLVDERAGGCVHVPHGVHDVRWHARRGEASCPEVGWKAVVGLAIVEGTAGEVYTHLNGDLSQQGLW